MHGAPTRIAAGFVVFVVFVVFAVVFVVAAIATAVKLRATPTVAAVRTDLISVRRKLGIRKFGRTTFARNYLALRRGSDFFSNTQEPIREVIDCLGAKRTTVCRVEGACYGCGDDNPISLGLRFHREGDVCVAHFIPRPDHRGVPGFLHGGVSSTVLDETMASVGYMLDNVHCVTATLELKFRKPIPLNGNDLRIEAWRDVAAPKRSHKVHGRILLSDGVVAVQATGIFVSVRSGDMAWSAT